MDTLPTAIISGPEYQAHQPSPRHPESPARAEAVQAVASRLLTEDRRFMGIAPTPASFERLATVHSPKYLTALRQFCVQGDGTIDLNTQASPASFETARLAAGGLLAGVEAVLDGQAANAFALVRPPGHHAPTEGAMGFCLLNNVAIAAKYLLDEVGLERVLIVDWDVHHGNGTQDIFWEDERVLFFSTHQSPLYPGTGALTATGAERGRGYTVNVPLPAGCGDAMLERVYESLLMPLAERFQPQFVLISAGYDGHWSDPLAGLNLTVEGYGVLAGAVQEIANTFCQGRLALTLEGGYDLTALADSVEATLRRLAGASDAEIKRVDRAGAGPGGYSPQAGPLRELLTEARRIHRV